jgi:3-hydroxyisobutyrate dehydrogenase-like beta-hydroxyacid dehydrogenase
MEALNVGVLGLGIIGSQVAGHLTAAGFNARVWNRTRPAGELPAGWRDSASEVVESCEIVQLFVSDEHAVMGVLEGVERFLSPAHVVVCSSTIGRDATLEACRCVEARGARFLDAPFTGSRVAAGRKQLVYYVGGEPGVLERARPVLEASSRRILEVGGVGAAAVFKVVTNLIAAVSVQALGEALALVEKAGLDPERFAEALGENACRSGTLDLKLPKMRTGDYEPHFSLRNMLKDVDYALGMARECGLRLGATESVGDLMRSRLVHGEGEQDFAVIYRGVGGPL